MQGYSYSIFSIVAIAIHLMLNFDLLAGRSGATLYTSRYRGFLFGVLAYYISDAAWGILAGLGWTGFLYADTILFFLSNVVFAIMWCRFAVVYLDVGKWPAKLLNWTGYFILAANVAALVVNVFNGCVFHFDAEGRYLCGSVRDPLFDLLIAFMFLISLVALAKTIAARDAIRSRDMMVFILCATLATALVLQVVWPLTPFTALGCLIGNCFFHVFVVRDEQNARHMGKLEAALDRARRAEKAKSLVFSMVSHDIRTPLNAILGYAELIENGITDEKEKEEALRSIRASGRTLLQLVNDVLDFAKIDSGKMTLVLEPTRLDALTDDVFSSFRLTAAEKGVELVNQTAGVPAVVVDSHRFRQILFNLVGNALKATERGKVKVIAAYSEGCLEVVVSDTGRGIPADALAHVFEPFYQVRDPSRSAYSEVGTGLGLPICRNIVNLMGGDISAASEAGKGTAFRIRIPRVAKCGGSAVGPAKPTQGAAPKSLAGRVLVVDDSPVNRSVLRAFLRRAGVASIDCACDGAEAFAKLDAAAKAGEPLDFVFTDFWMPNVNGLDLVKNIRADPRFEKLPVFAVTADSECRHDDRSNLFTGILLKPMTYEKLMESLAKCAC